MNTIDVGNFIALQRKKIQLTQKELAEKLNVTDKAVSKWETGKCYPDIEIIEKLSVVFGVGINEILSGRIIEPEEQVVEAEKNVVDIMKNSKKKQKRLKKIVLILSLIIIYFTVFCPISLNIIGTAKEKFSYDIDKWDFIEESMDFIPSVAEMGSYSEIKYKHLNKDIFFFESSAHTLTATYSKENYVIQKELFKNQIIFQEDFKEEYSDKYMRANFDIDDYDFYLASFKEYGLWYPKELVFIGFSDIKNEITFICYFDTDLDYIDNSFEEFLFYDCGWNREESLRRLYYFW